MSRFLCIKCGQLGFDLDELNSPIKAIHTVCPKCKAEEGLSTFITYESGKLIDYVPPSWDETFMREVYLSASKSKDPMTKIGAVLVKENHSILRGYNGIAKGVRDIPERMERPEKYDWMVHAEHNACLMGAKFGISTDKSTLYTQGMPCVHCADAVINSGIKEIVLHNQWEQISTKITQNRPWTDVYHKSKIKFDEAGVNVRYFDKFLDVCGYLDGKVFRV